MMITMTMLYEGRNLKHKITDLENWIVLQYFQNKDLKSFLMVLTYCIVCKHPGKIKCIMFVQTHRRSLKSLMKYMIDVAMGMHYLSERGLVHRVR